MSEIPNSNIIQCELNNCFKSKQLILDTNGAYTSEFDISDVSTISDLKQETYNMHAKFIAYSNGPVTLILTNDEKNHTENRRLPGCTLENINLSNAESSKLYLNAENISTTVRKNRDFLLNMYKQKISRTNSYLRDNTPIDPKKNPFQIISKLSF